MINELLKQLGFNDKEIIVYLALLKHGKIPPADLAKVTGINRTTVYSTAKELLKKGVIAEDLGGAVLYLVALPPEDLRQLVRKKEQRLAKEKEVVESAIIELAELTQQAKYHVPKIRFVFEEDLDDYLYKQTPKWNESISKYDKTWWGVQDHTFVEYYEQWINWYWTEGSTDERLKLFSNRSDIEKAMKKKKFTRRIINFWNNIEDVTATIWILGNYIIMIYTRQSPRYLVEIHDEVMAHNMREMYKGIWKEVFKT